MLHSIIHAIFARVIWGELDNLLIDPAPGTGDGS